MAMCQLCDCLAGGTQLGKLLWFRFLYWMMDTSICFVSFDSTNTKTKKLEEMPKKLLLQKQI